MSNVWHPFQCGGKSSSLFLLSEMLTLRAAKSYDSFWQEEKVFPPKLGFDFKVSTIPRWQNCHQDPLAWASGTKWRSMKMTFRRAPCNQLELSQDVHLTLRFGILFQMFMTLCLSMWGRICDENGSWGYLAKHVTKLHRKWFSNSCLSLQLFSSKTSNSVSAAAPEKSLVEPE